MQFAGDSSRETPAGGSLLLRRRAFGVTLAAALVAAGAAALALGVTPDPDGYARIARAVGPAPWLTWTTTKPFEMALANALPWLPLEPELVWRGFGAVQLALLLALLVRLGARLAGHALGGLGAAALVLASPFALEHALAMNSVATLALGILLFVEAGFAESGRGRALALALIALSRPDGALLAGLLAAAAGLDAAPGRRLRTLVAGAAVLGAAALVWLVTDRVANGAWLGFLAVVERFDAVIPFRRLSLPGLALWLRGAWLTLTGEALLLLAVLGALRLLARPGGRAGRALVWALVGHQAVLVWVGVSGGPLGYRYFLPEVVLGALLAMEGLCALAASLPAAGVALARLRIPRPLLAAGLALVALGGHFADARELASLARAGATQREDVDRAAACLEREIAGRPRATAIAPTPLAGALGYRLRAAPLRELTWELWFAGGGVAPSAAPHLRLLAADAPRPPAPAGFEAIAERTCPDAAELVVQELRARLDVAAPSALPSVSRSPSGGQPPPRERP